jgi:hypothetical protein
MCYRSQEACFVTPKRSIHHQYICCCCRLAHQVLTHVDRQSVPFVTQLSRNRPFKGHSLRTRLGRGWVQNMPVLINRLLHRSFRSPKHTTHSAGSSAAGGGADADDDIDDKDTDDDDVSLLSHHSDDNDQEHTAEYNSLEYFQHRDRLLNRILGPYHSDDENHSHAAFCHGIRHRERAVRLLHCQYVEPPHDIKAQYHLVLTELLQVVSRCSCSEFEHQEQNGDRPLHCSSFWKDFWIFERHSSIPAVFCLVLHSMAHSALEDFVKCIVGRTTMMISLVGGVLLLRLSGDLYWWIDDDTYQVCCVDFENRQQLGGDVEMDCSQKIRRRPVLRAIFFMVGYPMCYAVSTTLNGSVEKYFFNQYESIVSKMPSTLHEERYGTCPADMSFCSLACQEHLQNRGR